MRNIEEVAACIADAPRLRRAIISGRRKSFTPPFQRIDIRPVEIRDELLLQLVFHDGKQDLTKNLKPEAFDLGAELAKGYANLRVETDSEIIEVRISKKGEFFIHQSPNSSEIVDRSHDRKKERMLEVSDPIFRYLGISDADGRLIPRWSDKYNQVDQFLRIIDSLKLEHGDEPIRIIDLGCGSAYLTFTVHRYLEKNGHTVRVIGVDSRADSKAKNIGIAKAAGIEIEFVATSITDYQITPTDLVIALHACDTATDDALAWTVRSGAKAILAAPCCHHQMNRDIKGKDPAWTQLFKSGIVKERFADLITDSLRTQILRVLGYRADVIEFVSIEHTPRNLMIRAIKSDPPADGQELAALQSLIAEWNVSPYLLGLLADRIPKQAGR